MKIKMTTKERYARIIGWFEENMPIAESELHYENAYQLLVSVILSAQCTDRRVNMVTPALFAAFPEPEILAASNEYTVFEYIKSISYPNSKSKYLIAMAQMLVKDFNSQVPDNVEDLQRLPGVGRKTANVVASVIYNQPTMAVDTHVFRISERLGLTTNSKTPLQTERELTKYIPEKLIPKAHHWLILHGRYICQARKPKCNECSLSQWCRFYELKLKKMLIIPE